MFCCYSITTATALRHRHDFVGFIPNHPLDVQGTAEKSGPLNFFAVFSATVWDFNTKFYSFIY